jgi:4-alpha-glucanotransferase
LAAAAGIAVRWRDVQGDAHDVSDDTLHAVLTALGHQTGSAAQIAESLAAARHSSDRLPRLVTAVAGDGITLPAAPARTHLVLEDGRTFDGFAEAARGGCAIPPILEPGYHRLHLGDQETTIAVAPRRCPIWCRADGRWHWPRNSMRCAARAMAA